MFKAALLVTSGIGVLVATLVRAFGDAVPDVSVMGSVGALALVANLTSVAILLGYRDGDSNVRSVWLCSRNDAIGNVAVLFAAAGVWGTATFWPDLLVAMIMASVFVAGGVSILRQALQEQHAAGAAALLHRTSDDGCEPRNAVETLPDPTTIGGAR
jgi:Co/Zn/Cd efflux system component